MTQVHMTAAMATKLVKLRRNMRLKKGGPIAERTAQLLADRSLSLDEIAKTVRHDIEGAKTSAKAVASIAAQLRRDGYDIPDRRMTHH